MFIEAAVSYRAIKNQTTACNSRTLYDVNGCSMFTGLVSELVCRSTIEMYTVCLDTQIFNSLVISARSAQYFVLGKTFGTTLVSPGLLVLLMSVHATLSFGVD